MMLDLWPVWLAIAAMVLMLVVGSPVDDAT